MHNRFTFWWPYSAHVDSSLHLHSSEPLNTPDEEEGEVESTAGRFRDILLNPPVRMGHINHRSKLQELTYSTYKLCPNRAPVHGHAPGPRDRRTSPRETNVTLKLFM